MGSTAAKAGVVLLAAAAAALGGAPVAFGAPADPAPAAHQVRYSLTTGDAADFDLYYLATQPADMAAYNADPYTYLKKVSVTVAPDAPWTFETTLADPSWAILTVSSTTHGLRAAPNAHCDIAVDGQVAVQQDAPYNMACQLSKW